MPTYDFYYFPVRARGETSRMLLAMSGQPWENHMLKGDAWQKFKPTTLSGQLPELHIGGVRYNQSRAIERYLAKTFGYYGKDEAEQLKSDMVVDTVEELLTALIKVRWTKPEEAKKVAVKEFNEGKGATYMKNLEKMASDKGFFVGDKVSWADLAFYVAFDHSKSIEGVKFDTGNLPKLMKVVNNVELHPKVVEWFKSRPETAF